MLTEFAPEIRYKLGASIRYYSLRDTNLADYIDKEQGHQLFSRYYISDGNCNRALT
jgi:hypothetical protein